MHVHVLIVHCVQYNIAAFSIPPDELQSQYLTPQSQVTVVVIFRDQGTEEKHLTGLQVYGHQACQHRRHE